MKIVKTKLYEKLDEVEDGAVDMTTASSQDLQQDMEQTAEETGVEMTKAAMSQEAKDAIRYGRIIYNPYGTSNPGKLKKILQRSLDAALRKQRRGDRSNFPNILIYGQAGVGKTAIVHEFCREHNIAAIPIDASTLNPEELAGLPYAIDNKFTGEKEYASLRSPKWKALNRPCIIICDEVNRANARVVGSLYKLINEHTLPITVNDLTDDDSDLEDDTFDYSKTDEQEVFYPNILFTVSVINPPSAAFKQTVTPLDAAFIGRNSAVYGQTADNNELDKYFKGYVNKLNADEFIKPKQLQRKAEDFYKSVLEDPNISNYDKLVYEGQADLMHAMLSNGLQFNTQREIDDIYLAHKNTGVTYNYLSPRTLTLFLTRSNGTKKDFLDVINNESGLNDTDKAKIRNSLATYVDSPAVGNNVFKKNNVGASGAANAQSAQPAHSAINSLEATDVIKDFLDAIS